ncbi:LytR/AlgR family response regulator transcription factor [Algoriphagus mannitolivorans]|uniref:LytR/AlgR family response regulator transcription factor n=1 Tax=Algoriphagus mannitolivorans TaxID=226504 RepID=UPI000685DDA1|nr:LytTR family DNA-binding domain-containing protein [Algoriphagus mannitolivorans]
MNILLCSADSTLLEMLSSDLGEFWGQNLNISLLEQCDDLNSIPLGSIDLIIAEFKLGRSSILEKLKQEELNIPVIFIGEKEQFVPEIFQLFALDFLIKPVQKESLQRALAKVNQALNFPTRLNGLKSYKKRFLTKIGNRLTLIPVEKIACFFAEGGITFLMESGSSQKYMVDQTLNELETHLLDPEKFYRINRSIIVNLDNLVEMKPFQNGRLLLSLKAKTEDSFIVAREKVNSFKAWVDR